MSAKTTFKRHLANEMTRILEHNFGVHEIIQVWTDDHSRVLFRLSDGRTGDIEASVNWDISTNPNTTEDSHASHT